jgi:hypothetical protein
MIFENTGFDVNYWSRLSLNEFIEECLRDGIMNQYNGDERIEVLKVIYQIIQEEYDRQGNI